MTEEQNHRQRTVTWGDPRISASAASKMDGLSFLQAVFRGEFPKPPVMILLGFDLLEIEKGRAVYGLAPAEYHYNPIGSVHGGVTSTLLDSALACAIQSELPAGFVYTTVQLNINLVRALTDATGYVRCEGKTIYVGRKMATAEARIFDEAGKVYAHGTTTCMILQTSAD